VPYSAEISRSNPTAFLFLIDQSGSMSDPVGQTQMTRAQFVCDALNRVVANLIARCSKAEGVRDYFEIGAIGYGGARVGNALKGYFEKAAFHPISAFEKHPVIIEQRRQKIPDGAGGIIEQTIQFPIWFTPQADGGTPMRKAIRLAAESLALWCDEHPDSYPPTVLHVTDGEPSDGDPEPVAEQLRQIGTDDGDILFFNLHSGQGKGPPLQFADDENVVLDPYGKSLFRMSSTLPDVVAQAAREKGYSVAPASRGFFFNVEPIEIVEFFDIGTRASSQSLMLR
jgi:hypothetical protein